MAVLSSIEHPDRLSILSSLVFKGYLVVKLTSHLRLMPRLGISGAALFSAIRFQIIRSFNIIVLQIVSVRYCVKCRCHAWHWCQWYAVRSLENERVTQDQVDQAQKAKSSVS
jgi:hypothetical protein